MAELLGLLIILCVLIYGAAIVVVTLGAAGWYLSFPVLGVLTALVVAWPIFSYQRQIRRERWTGSFWYEKGFTIFLSGIGLAIIWGCALRDQLTALWDSITPFVLR